MSARKMALIQWLIELKDLQVLRQIEALSHAQNPSPDSLTAEQKAGLAHALQQIERGEIQSGEAVRKRLSEQFNL